jgi:hypothetical protein
MLIIINHIIIIIIIIVIIIIIIITIIIISHSSLVISKLRSQLPYGVIRCLKWFLYTVMLHCHCAYLFVILTCSSNQHLLIVK